MIKFFINCICFFIPVRKWRRSCRDSMQKRWIKVPAVYPPCVPRSGIFYKGRTEVGAVNFSDKLKRAEAGQPFELPEMIATNKVMVDLLGPDDKKIVNIGAGTGTFEYLAAKKHPGRTFVASEFDTDCVQWCRQHRRLDNIIFTSLTFDELKQQYGTFDCAVSADVIEHVADYASFLRSMKDLAPNAIIATPNKDRTIKDAIAAVPHYYQHTREWDAGEFYWILKCFYSDVKLYSIAVYEDKENLDMRVKFKEVGLLSTHPKLIARCRR